MNFSTFAFTLLATVLLHFPAIGGEPVTEQGVTFPAAVEKSGTTLQLNGVAVRKAFGFIKVFVGGFYLETPTRDPETAILSEQAKYFRLHYLTDKATAEKISEGFIEAITEANEDLMVQKHQQSILQYASWLDQDMKPGSTSESLYIPGEGLTLWVNGEKKGTIENPEFAEMYYRYTLGEQANSRLRKGYLGLD